MRRDVIALAPAGAGGRDRRARALASGPRRGARARTAWRGARGRGALPRRLHREPARQRGGPVGGSPAARPRRMAAGRGRSVTAFLAAAPADAGSLTAARPASARPPARRPAREPRRGARGLPRRPRRRSGAHRSAGGAGGPARPPAAALGRGDHPASGAARSSNPVRVASLRALLRIARARGHDVAVATALSLLRALGLATPDERRRPARRLPIPLDKKPRFANPAWETARALAQEAAEEIGQALGVGTSAPGDPRGITDAVAPLPRGDHGRRGVALARPPCSRSRSRSSAETITLVAQLTAEDDAVSGDGRIVNALRRGARPARPQAPQAACSARRRPTTIAAIDFAAWRGRAARPRQLRRARGRHGRAAHRVPRLGRGGRPGGRRGC